MDYYTNSIMQLLSNTTIISMKTNLIFRIILFFGFITIINSCQKDQILTDVRDNYLGKWSVTEKNKKTAKITKYEISISLSKQDDDIIFAKNFANLGYETQAKLNVFDYVIILNEQDIDGFRIKGTQNGKAKSDYSRFDLNYKMEDDEYICSFEKI